MSVIEDIKQKTDIIEVISQFTTLKKSGRTFRGLCPFHSEKAPSFFVYPEQQSWHCFGACNTGGDVFAFIMKKHNIGFGEALRLLADRSGIILPARIEHPGEKDEKDRLFEANQAAATFFQESLINNSSADKARSYLKKRGLDLKTTLQFQLGYALNEWETLKQYMQKQGFVDKELLSAGLIIAADDGRLHDRFRNKLMIPICDIKGRVCGFGARVLDDSLPKYVNSPQTPVFDKSGSLYGINYAADAIRKQDMVVVVEGYMDVIIAHQYGFNNVIASMGTAITDKQINIIKKLSRHVSLALDSDTAGEEAMLRGVNYENTLDQEVKVIVLPAGKDPDEVIKEDGAGWGNLVNSGIPVVDYTFNAVTQGLILTKVKDKSVAVEKLLPIVAGIKNDIRRDHYLNKLAEITNTSYRNMEMALSKISSPPRKVNRSTSTVETNDKLVQSFVSSPIEEVLLSLLLQYPELKKISSELLPEYFENTENRELFVAWQASSDIEGLKERLDNTVQEHFELLLARNYPDTNIEKKYADCSLRLREKYLRNMEKKKAQVLALEREEGGTDAELARLAEQGIGISENLKTVFTKRSQYRRR
jgi:DNA primase